MNSNFYYDIHVLIVWTFITEKEKKKVKRRKTKTKRKNINEKKKKIEKLIIVSKYRQIHDKNISMNFDNCMTEKICLN